VTFSYNTDVQSDTTLAMSSPMVW